MCISEFETCSICGLGTIPSLAESLTSGGPQDSPVLPVFQAAGINYFLTSPLLFIPRALSSLLPPPPSGPGCISYQKATCKPSPGGRRLPLLPIGPSTASGPFGSFCGLGLLFLSTVVRKPLPQKVSAGGLVYRGTPRRAPGGSHTKPEAINLAVR